MARFCAEHETVDKISAANSWKALALMEMKSMFSDSKIWTIENIKSLDTYFVNNQDTGDGDFFEKLETQLEGTTPEVKKLVAEMLWLMLLCPSNIGPDKKRESITRVWSLSGDELDEGHPLLSNNVLSGIGSSGTSFNTNRWRELIYFIKFCEQFYHLTVNERNTLLDNPFGFAEWLGIIPENESRQLRHMFLFLLFPDSFERIFGGTDRRQIVHSFTSKSKAVIKKLTALEIDKELLAIRTQQEKDFDSDSLDFYIPPLKEQWKDKTVSHWLFSWNQDNWKWDNLISDIATTATGKTVIHRWSCANSNIKPGDRAWMIRLGVEPKGIMATGNVVSEPYSEKHWDKVKADQGEACTYVDIEFTQIIDIFKDAYISVDDLALIKIDKQTWLPQQSGIEIKKRSAGLLEKLWNRITEKQVDKHEQIKNVIISDPVNSILYGPPGTGKTFELNRMLSKYQTTNNDISRAQWISQELDSIRWFDVVFMALYTLGGRANVTSILEHEFIVQKAKVAGRTKHLRQQIWQTLQAHASEDSKTVKYNKRQSPLIFDKSPDSTWFLHDDWEDACSEFVSLANRLKEGPDHNDINNRYEFVTFHQAYSYEDFVEGIRPVQDEESGELAYQVVPGVFRRLCQQAKNDPKNRYAIFIDEINRGNISKIFGELITLIEKDKRATYDNKGNIDNIGEGMQITLPYSSDKFSVPKNLDIYGTMNTADRSIALLDTALRRRFTFKELMPNPKVITGSRGDGYIEDGQGGVISLREMLTIMNIRIKYLLSRDMMLGHAYLTKVKDFDDLKDVLVNQFIPLLQEYFYDDWHKIQLVLGDIGPVGQKIEPQIVQHNKLNSTELLGFEHDDFEDLIEYTIAAMNSITPDSIRKIYESQVD